MSAFSDIFSIVFSSPFRMVSSSTDFRADPAWLDLDMVERAKGDFLLVVRFLRIGSCMWHQSCMVSGSYRVFVALPGSYDTCKELFTEGSVSCTENTGIYVEPERRTEYSF